MIIDPNTISYQYRKTNVRDTVVSIVLMWFSQNKSKCRNDIHRELRIESNSTKGNISLKERTCSILLRLPSLFFIYYIGFNVTYICGVMDCVMQEQSDGNKSFRFSVINAK